MECRWFMGPSPKWCIRHVSSQLTADRVLGLLKSIYPMVITHPVSSRGHISRLLISMTRLLAQPLKHLDDIILGQSISNHPNLPPLSENWCNFQDFSSHFGLHLDIPRCFAFLKRTCDNWRRSRNRICKVHMGYYLCQFTTAPSHIFDCFKWIH